MANGIDIDVGQSLLVGPQGPQGEIGPRGYGIKTIAKTGTDGLVDTYTVTFDDDRTATFEVTNGRAISSIDLTSTVENVDTYTITYNDGTTSTFTVTNSNVSREEFEKAVELTNSEMDNAEVEGEKLKLKGVATTNLGITVQGNTYQETTTGKNLLNYTITQNEVTTNGVTRTLNSDGSITLNGTATAITWFTLNSGFNWAAENYTMYLNETELSGLVLYSDVGNARTLSNITVTEAITKGISLRVTAGTTFDNLTIYPMLLKGTYTLDTIGEYEPFTNGPSPNPDFPQEIQVVTGDNEVQIQGKNLLNVPNTYSVTTNANVPTSLPAGTYTISIEDYETDVEVGNSFLIQFKSGDTIVTDTYISMNSKKNTKTIPSEIDGIRIFSSSSYHNSAGKTTTFKNLMLELGSTASDYEPYIDANYPISLGTLELAKIGDYKDYIHKDGDNWYKHKAIGKVVFNGSESWGVFESGTVYKRLKIKLNPAALAKEQRNICFSDYFLYCNDYTKDVIGSCFIQLNTGDFFVYPKQQDSVNEFRTWLSQNNPQVHYVLATPVEEQITDTTLIQQLEALNQATARGNNFTITTETENLKPVLKVEYKESTRYKAYDLENRVEKLEEQIKHAGHVYGVRRKRENNSSSEWERTDDAIGLVANATHDGTEVQNDFDNLSPWKDIISFNLDLETGHKKAYYGDPDFAFDGSNGDVYTHIPDIYYRVWHDGEYDYVQIADFAESEFEKCDKFDIQRYKTGMVNNVLHSYSNIPPATSRNITSFRVLTQEIGQDYCLLDWRYFVIQLLYLVEYANYNSQAMLGKGFSSMRNNVADVSLLAEANTHRFVVNTNAGNDFIVGQTVCVGTSLGQYDIAENRKITAITDYDEGGITGKIITLNGAAFSTTITSVIWSGAQPSGQCDSLGMKSGCLADDGKHEVIYRGIEDIYGNIHCFVDGINLKDRRAYICYDPAEYVSDKFEEPYEAIGYANSNSGGGYIKNLGFDINNPLIRLPVAVGGANNTYITDYYYSDSGDRIVRIGGIVNTGYNNGLWYWSLNGGLSSAGWNCGARVIKYK